MAGCVLTCRLDEVSVPESIRLVLGQRLGRLAASTREVLVAAAVSGRVFASELVGEVAEAGPDQLVDAFDEAERARLITSGKTAGELMFSHELIRQTLLSGVSAIKRERLHLQAATAISRLYSDDLEAHAGELAYHLSHAGRSGDRASLVHYLTIAGERAFDAAAFDDAVGYFEKALSLMPNDGQLGRAQLLERLAMALRSVGRWEDALGTMNDALDRYETLGQVEAIGRLGWAMVYQLVWTARFVEGVEVGRRTLAALGNTVSADKARLLSALAFAISVSGDYAAARATFDQARALAEQVGNERAMADVLHMQTIHHFVYAEFAEGVRVGLRAAETFERESALWDLCSVQAFVIYRRRQSRQSRAGDHASPTRRLASPSGWATSARPSWCSPTGSASRRCSATCRRWRRSVRRSWTSASEADCRGATWATSTWAWLRTGEAMLSAPRLSCETPSSWSRRARSPGKAPRCWRGTSPTTGAPRR